VRRTTAVGLSPAAAVEEDERHVPAQPHLVLDVGQALGFAWHLRRRADELRLAPAHGAVERHDDDRAPEQTIWSPSYEQPATLDQVYRGCTWRCHHCV